MKRILFLVLITLLIASDSEAQKYFTKTGKIYFDATSPGSPERVEATHRTATCVVDIQTGSIQFAMLMKGFEFERALMQEHFNENYVESDKYPNATLKGKVTNISQIDFTKNGSYTAEIEGDLTIHGTTQSIKETGTFEVKDDKVNGKSKLTILLADYGISIPAPVVDKIAREIEITVDVMLEKVAE